MSLKLKRKLIKIQLNKKVEIFKGVWEHNQGKSLNYKIIVDEDKEVYNTKITHPQEEEAQQLQ